VFVEGGGAAVPWHNGQSKSANLSLAKFIVAKHIDPRSVGLHGGGGVACQRAAHFIQCL